MSVTGKHTTGLVNERRTTCTIDLVRCTVYGETNFTELTLVMEILP